MWTKSGFPISGHNPKVDGTGVVSRLESLDFGTTQEPTAAMQLVTSPRQPDLSLARTECISCPLKMECAEVHTVCAGTLPMK